MQKKNFVNNESPNKYEESGLYEFVLGYKKYVHKFINNKYFWHLYIYIYIYIHIYIYIYNYNVLLILLY